LPYQKAPSILTMASLEAVEKHGKNIEDKTTTIPSISPYTKGTPDHSFPWMTCDKEKNRLTQAKTKEASAREGLRYLKRVEDILQCAVGEVPSAAKWLTRIGLSPARTA
jgi:hypothetical protein